MGTSVDANDSSGVRLSLRTFVLVLLRSYNMRPIPARAPQAEREGLE